MKGLKYRPKKKIEVTKLASFLLKEMWHFFLTSHFPTSAFCPEGCNDLHRRDTVILRILQQPDLAVIDEEGHSCTRTCSFRTKQEVSLSQDKDGVSLQGQKWDLRKHGQQGRTDKSIFEVINLFVK